MNAPTRWRATVPDPVTGRPVPFRGEAGIPIEYTARDRADALRLARVNRLPPAVDVEPIPRKVAT
jgi:hypothetical protein